MTTEFKIAINGRQRRITALIAVPFVLLLVPLALALFAFVPIVLTGLSLIAIAAIYFASLVLSIPCKRSCDAISCSNVPS
jgi:hypothetical protein